MDHWTCSKESEENEIAFDALSTDGVANKPKNLILKLIVFYLL